MPFCWLQIIRRLQQKSCQIAQRAPFLCTALRKLLKSVMGNGDRDALGGPECMRDVFMLPRLTADVGGHG